MSEFPRGWIFYSFANATGNAQITVPGVSGVTHVLDTVQASASAFAATALFLSSVQIAGGPFWNLLVQGIAGAGVSTDSISYGGLDFHAGVSNPLVVGFGTAAVTGIFLNLAIQGHDI